MSAFLTTARSPAPKTERSIGSSANNVEKPPENYKDTDLKLHANDGSLAGVNDKVRVSGKLIYGPDSTILFAPVDVQKL